MSASHDTQQCKAVVRIKGHRGTVTRQCRNRTTARNGYCARHGGTPQ